MQRGATYIFFFFYFFIFIHLLLNDRAIDLESCGARVVRTVRDSNRLLLRLGWEPAAVHDGVLWSVSALGKRRNRSTVVLFYKVNDYP